MELQSIDLSLEHEYRERIRPRIYKMNKVVLTYDIAQVISKSITTNYIKDETHVFAWFSRSSVTLKCSKVE